MFSRCRKVRPCPNACASCSRSSPRRNRVCTRPSRFSNRCSTSLELRTSWFVTLTFIATGRGQNPVTANPSKVNPIQTFPARRSMRARHPARLAAGLRAFAQDARSKHRAPPAYFDGSHRNAAKDAARIAGLDVARLANEPTACGSRRRGVDWGSLKRLALIRQTPDTFLCDRRSIPSRRAANAAAASS